MVGVRRTYAVVGILVAVSVTGAGDAECETAAITARHHADGTVRPLDRALDGGCVFTWPAVSGDVTLTLTLSDGTTVEREVSVGSNACGAIQQSLEIAIP